MKDIGQDDSTTTRRGNARFFVLSTICIIPFSAFLILVLTICFTPDPMFTRLWMYSLFFLPGFLILALVGLVFFSLAWRRSPKYRPVLLVYLLIILVFWSLVATTTPR
jgi:hypothetical protein